MKSFLNVLSLCFFLSFSLIACNKDSYSRSPEGPRTIKFQLYTAQDFSADDRNITFSLFIRTHQKTIFDSTLAPMKIKDIPTFETSLLFKKPSAAFMEKTWQQVLITPLKM